MKNNSSELTIIGAGLAGSEAALQAADRGIKVSLFEMRPNKNTDAHETGYCAELICSNSLGSNLPTKAPGLLKAELRMLGSKLIEAADNHLLPAGSALAVDRISFSKAVTELIENHPNIQLIREEICNIPNSPCIIASGPLTSDCLSVEINKLTGKDRLFFFDALAPIITGDSIDMETAFRGSRYNKGVRADGDYINCPFNKQQYETFVNEIREAKTIPLREFEHEITSGVTAGKSNYFEGCLPVEVIAKRGMDSLAFGPLRPKGLFNPHATERPYAVLQLRQDNLHETHFNMVGFQTNLTYTEQKRIFRMIPGLENAEFVRFGQMHRNTFIASPELLFPTLQMKNNSNLFFAGQITGVEGYASSIASGLLAGINAANMINNKNLIHFPVMTMTGALMNFITSTDMKDFQPMKSNFGIMPPHDEIIKNKKLRYEMYTERSLAAMKDFIECHMTEQV